jgi:hypothetical protein
MHGLSWFFVGSLKSPLLSRNGSVVLIFAVPYNGIMLADGQISLKRNENDGG